MSNYLQMCLKYMYSYVTYVYIVDHYKLTQTLMYTVVVHTLHMYMYRHAHILYYNPCAAWLTGAVDQCHL